MNHDAFCRSFYSPRRRRFLFAAPIVLALVATHQLALAQPGAGSLATSESHFDAARTLPAASSIFYVTDYQAGEIQYFPPSGGTGKVLASMIIKATGLAFDSAATLYVASDSSLNHEATIYTIPAKGGSPSIFYQGSDLREAHGLAFDSNGNLFVATASGQTVLEFMYPFTPLDRFFSGPARVALERLSKLDSLQELYANFRDLFPQRLLSPTEKGANSRRRSLLAGYLLDCCLAQASANSIAASVPGRACL